MDKKPPIEKPIDPTRALQDFLDKEKIILTATPEFTPTNHGTFEVRVRIGVRRK